MNSSRRVVSFAILLIVVCLSYANGEPKAGLGENAALRYWAAFAQMQDSAITDQQAKDLNLILEGTSSLDDAKYKDLIEKNIPALETMVRGTGLRNCDWGLDYQLGPETPVDYVRKALPLGRLNVLYALHLLSTGNKDGAVRVLTAGLRFSRDIANGGTLLAAAAAKDLLTSHLKAIQFAGSAGLSPASRLALQKAIAQFGPSGLDWRSAMKGEFAILSGLKTQDPVALARISASYFIALDNPNELPKLEQLIATSPRSLSQIIPNPKRVLKEKQDLEEKLQQTSGLLRSK